MKKKTLLPLLAILISGAAWSQSSSYVSVEKMLEIDNAQAVKRMQELAGKSGLEAEKAAPVAIRKPPRRIPVWAVASIYGADGVMHANLQGDATRYDGLKVGEKAGSCVVQTIDTETRCVGLTRLSKKVPASDCPSTVCWTGSEPITEQAATDSPNNSASIKPMPMPLPTR